MSICGGIFPHVASFYVFSKTRYRKYIFSKDYISIDIDIYNYKQLYITKIKIFAHVLI